MGKKLDALLGRRHLNKSKFKALVKHAVCWLAVLKSQHRARCSVARSDVQLLNLGHHDRALLRVTFRLIAIFGFFVFSFYFWSSWIEEPLEDIQNSRHFIQGVKFKENFTAIFFLRKQSVLSTVQKRLYFLRNISWKNSPCKLSPTVSPFIFHKTRKIVYQAVQRLYMRGNIQTTI